MDQTKITREEETRRVTSPAWLQRRMRRNLVKASLNRFNEVRARTASELLACIYNDEHEVAVPLDSEPVADQRHQINSKPAIQSARNTGSKLPHEAVGLWRKWFDRLSAFRKRRK